MLGLLPGKAKCQFWVDIKANRGKTKNVIGLLPTNSGSILKRPVKRDRSVAENSRSILKRTVKRDRPARKVYKSGDMFICQAFPSSSGGEWSILCVKK